MTILGSKSNKTILGNKSKNSIVDSRNDKWINFKHNPDVNELKRKYKFNQGDGLVVDVVED